MKNITFLLFITLVFASICFCLCINNTYAAEQSIITKYLPFNNSIAGFAIYEKSLIYAKGDDLTKIYDGGYELYTKNGVTEAVRQMYNRKTDYVEVTIHTLKSKEASRNFFKYWCKELKVKKITKTKKSSSFILAKPSVMGYSVVGKHIITISALYDSKKGVKDTKKFLSFIENKILEK